jgi:hypothetical protein
MDRTLAQRTKEEITKDIIEWFSENEDAFNDCIEELDNYNGYLGDDRYYCMDELNDLFCDCDKIEILNRAFFGYDEDNYITDSYGRVEHRSFNPNRDYFRFNGYGNLVSANYKDYSAQLDHYAVEEIADNRSNIYSIEDYDELKELFDEYESSEEE